MDFEKLQEVNKKLKKTDIKGKDYVEVNQRILGFRELYPNGTIETEIVNSLEGIVTIKAIIKDYEGRILATGHAQEKENSSFINKASYIENCETSAVGRALGILGIGADTSIRSLDEMENKEFQVTSNSKINKTKQDALKASIKNNKISDEKVQEILDNFSFEAISDITLKEYANVIEAFQKIINK